VSSGLDWRRRTLEMWAHDGHAVCAVAVPCLCHTDRRSVFVSCTCGHQLHGIFPPDIPLRDVALLHVPAGHAVPQGDQA